MPLSGTKAPFDKDKQEMYFRHLLHKGNFDLTSHLCLFLHIICLSFRLFLIPAPKHLRSLMHFQGYPRSWLHLTATAARWPTFASQAWWFAFVSVRVHLSNVSLSLSLSRCVSHPLTLFPHPHRPSPCIVIFPSQSCWHLLQDLLKRLKREDKVQAAQWIALLQV